MPSESRWGTAAGPSARSLWPVLVRKCEMGSSPPPAVPGIRLGPSPGFWPGGNLWRGNDAPSSRGMCVRLRLRNQESPARCATPLSCRFPPPSRGAVPARWEGWRRAFL